MPETDLTTLICLFHHQDHAQAALEDILKAGVPESNVTLIGPGSTIAANKSSLAELNVPEKDLQHLLDGITGGGALLTVSAISSLSDKVEAIFKEHSADKIDEAIIDDDMSAQALPVANAGALTDVDDEPAEFAAEPYNEPYDEAANVQVFRVVDLPPTAMGADSLEDEVIVTEVILIEPLADDFSDFEPVATTPAHPLGDVSPIYPGQPVEDVDPRELGLDSRMARHIVQVD